MPRLIALLVLALGLGACTSMRLIDNQVTSFAPGAIAAGSTYRFERLPSQHTPQQDVLERLAAESLAKVGLRLEATAAQLLVQVGASQREQTTFPNRGLEGSLGWGLGTRHPGSTRSLMLWMDQRTLYLREVSLILRDARTLEVLYETHASNDNPWPDTQASWGAMLDAALEGFPQPRQGPRQVNIEIPW